MKYIINKTSIVLFIDNKPVKVDKDDVRYSKVVECLQLPDDQVDEAVKKAVRTLKSIVKKVSVHESFNISDEGVFYKGDKLPDALAQKIRGIQAEGLPLGLFERFWDNLQLNPSATSVSELYDFLSYKELPITEDGCFLAYKGVHSGTYYSKMGNKNTKVLSGEVDSGGHIFNGIGEYIEVLRRDVDDNRQMHCSFGLHCGSLDYASDYSSNVVIVKVNPKDVVSVPSDYSCQKARVCAYTVVGQFESEIEAPVVDENLEPVENEEVKEVKADLKVATVERDAFMDRVDAYVKAQLKTNFQVPVRKIQNSFSPEWPKQERVLEALDALGYIWFKGNDGAYVQS